MRAIIINAEERTVSEADIDNSLGRLQEIVGGLIDAVHCGLGDTGHHCYVNDEGLLNDPQHFFMLRNGLQPLAGNGVILSATHDGNEAPCTLSLDWVKERVAFMDLQAVRQWAVRQWAVREDRPDIGSFIGEDKPRTAEEEKQRPDLVAPAREPAALPAAPSRSEHILLVTGEDGEAMFFGPYPSFDAAMSDAEQLNPDLGEHPTVHELADPRGEFDRTAELKERTDLEKMNDDRAEWAGAALRHFQCTTGTDYEDTLTDLLGDLMHWADRNGVDFNDELARARMHYEAEIAPELVRADSTNERDAGMERDADSGERERDSGRGR